MHLHVVDDTYDNLDCHDLDSIYPMVNDQSNLILSKIND